MNGAADWLATILIALIAGVIGFAVIMWITDRLIEALDWMTRHE
jgi:hypothetical protein